MKTTIDLIKQLKNAPMGRDYLEKGMIQKELCVRFGFDFYTVLTHDFERRCDAELSLGDTVFYKFIDGIKVTAKFPDCSIEETNMKAHRERFAGINKIDELVENVEDRNTVADPQPGDLFVATWGATMRRNNFYQVVKREGPKVWLVTPHTQSNEKGYDCGHEWISAPYNSADNVQTEVKHAKIVSTKNGKTLKLCVDDTFKVKDHYWDELKPTKIGEKEYFHGD